MNLIDQKLAELFCLAKKEENIFCRFVTLNISRILESVVPFFGFLAFCRFVILPSVILDLRHLGRHSLSRRIVCATVFYTPHLLSHLRKKVLSQASLFFFFDPFTTRGRS